MVVKKKLKFFHRFISGPIRKENVFDNILERTKKLFYTIKKKNKQKRKNKKVKKSKNWHFSEGVTPWFRSKI